MGMFSEIHGEQEADRVAVVLRAAQREGPEVRRFVAQYVYPLYGAAIGEAWTSEDQEIRAFWKAQCEEFGIDPNQSPHRDGPGPQLPPDTIVIKPGS